jgi:hypothetical protein
MRGAIFGILAMLSAITPAAAKSTVVYSGEYWMVSLYTPDDADDSTFCTLEMNLVRQNGTQGYFAMAPFADGSVFITQQVDDWNVQDGRSYGSAIISIGRGQWRAQAKGVGNDTIGLTIAASQGYDFWRNYVVGQSMRITYPQDSLEITLRGSARAFGEMMDCYEVIEASGKFNPFGQYASDPAFNPFGN